MLKCHIRQLVKVKSGSKKCLKSHEQLIKSKVSNVQLLLNRYCWQKSLWMSCSCKKDELTLRNCNTSTYNKTLSKIVTKISENNCFELLQEKSNLISSKSKTSKQKIAS